MEARRHCRNSCAGCSFPLMLRFPSAALQCSTRFRDRSHCSRGEAAFRSMMPPRAHDTMLADGLPPRLSPCKVLIVGVARYLQKVMRSFGKPHIKRMCLCKVLQHALHSPAQDLPLPGPGCFCYSTRLLGPLASAGVACPQGFQLRGGNGCRDVAHDVQILLQ